ncbi:MAG: UPF0280 family protein [Rhodospirillaceae bacterium]|nr:UPF0280 family protein [Rhodospirillaceae bacterium]
MSGPTAALLPDGRRLHLQHGPIDLVIEAEGERAEVVRAYAQAEVRFRDLLDVLVRDLPLLRRPAGQEKPPVSGPVARRMVEAVWPHRRVFITPMAAVAGAVADEMLEALCAGRRLTRAYVNDGGDIALMLTPGRCFAVGLVAEIAAPAVDGILRVHADMPVRGVATSGWGGRSFSLGIADAVTVLARDAATADAAATMIANAVTVEHPAIERRPACEIQADTDLGDLPVTIAVGPLPAEAVRQALLAGHAEAERLRAAGLIHGAVLVLQRRYAVAGALPRIEGDVAHA